MTFAEPLQEALDGIARTGSLAEAVFDRLIDQYSEPNFSPIRTLTLQSLGFVFRSYPTLMLDEAATELMNGIFARSKAVTDHRQLLVVFHDVQSNINEDIVLFTP